MKKIKGYSAALPLRRDNEVGYTLLETHADVIAQNLKNLIFTQPGERIMIPKFGVGIKKYIFEQSDVTVFAQIASEIRLQVGIYMPFVNIQEVRVANSEMIWTDMGQQEKRNTDLGLNEITLGIVYEVPALREEFLLQVQI